MRVRMKAAIEGFHGDAIEHCYSQDVAIKDGVVDFEPVDWSVVEEMKQKGYDLIDGDPAHDARQG